MCHLILNEVNISRQCMHSEGGSIWAKELLRKQIIFVHNLLTHTKKNPVSDAVYVTIRYVHVTMIALHQADSVL